MKEKKITRPKRRRFDEREKLLVLWLYFGHTNPPFDWKNPIMTAKEVGEKSDLKAKSIRDHLKKLKAFNDDVAEWLKDHYTRGNIVQGLTK